MLSLSNAATGSGFAPVDIRTQIGGVAHFLPEKVLANQELAAIYPDWTAEKILLKTGIRERRIAAEGQTAADLAFEAAMRLFARGEFTPSQVDFLIFCTQAPDYVLPTSACVLQHRLGIPRSAGALDVNLGCSGFVYGLSLAKGLIETAAASCVLLLTADTYSKYINPMDKSVRTLFGDGAAATLMRPACGEPESSVGPFVFGTDGSGATNLIVKAGGFRHPRTPRDSVVEIDTSGNIRCNENLHMNGAEIMSFSLTEVPRAVRALMAKTGLGIHDFNFFVFHQANRFMLESLRKKLKIPAEKMPVFLEYCGNTVSSTIPITLDHLCKTHQLKRGHRMMVVGFGVGYSWAAAVVNF
jgi:3-oxoacyl-[acyl-carrier-protein] synthase-3